MTMSAQSFAYLRELIHTRSAIVLDAGKEYLVETRLAPVARAHGFDTLDALATALSRTPFGTVHRAAIEAMTTNETSFFRDIHPFDTLRVQVLPEIIARRRGTRTLNFWCAAASTGQESYSVAMLLMEHFPELRDWRLTFMATDLSAAVVARARDGRFTALEVNRGLPPALRDKYFVREDEHWQVKDELRRMIDFRELNLIEPWPAMRDVDIVFMRNVLIYFDVDTRRQILRKTRSVMSSDGYLLLGSAETTNAIDDAFERVQFGRGVTYRLRTATGKPLLASA